MATTIEPQAREATPAFDAEREARGVMEDAYAHFGYSNTRIHSLPREQAEAIQLAAVNMRLQQRREQIPVLAKLAEAQGIDRIEKLDDAAPLLFTHDMYKSYPISLLVKHRFDQLTTWLNRLTSYDISNVDVSGCDSIDSWLVRLQEQTPLDVATSSGTTGTLSLFPKSKKDYYSWPWGFRVQLIQKFGEEPTESDLNDKFHLMSPLYRDGHSSMGRPHTYMNQVLAHGDESYLHVAFPYKISSDLMWLAARLKAAAAKGDATRVDVPESLLARRGEWEKMQREMPAQQADFIRRATEDLKGKRVLALGTTPMFYQVAKQGLEEGRQAAFGPGSVVMGGGGAKGLVLPENTNEIIMKFFGVDELKMSYGMTELNSGMLSCEHGHYHLLPWVTLFLLDVDTGQPLPRHGKQSGRAGYFDPTHDGTWGGILTGDQITVDWDTPCACGRTSVPIEMKIQRISELQGGDDKITCAATPQAHGDAMDFLLNVES